MKVGDPKKAVVLAVVALMILGVAVFQIVPKGKHLATTLRQASEGQAPPSATPPAPLTKDDLKPLPTTLTSLPFAKPKTRAEQEKERELSKAKISLHGESPNPGTQPLVPTVTPEGSVHPMLGALPPGENTRDNQQIKVQAKTLTLQGVILVDKRVALIDVAGIENAPTRVQVGDRIGAYRVVGLDDSEITLKFEAKEGKRIRKKAKDSKPVDKQTMANEGSDGKHSTIKCLLGKTVNL